MKLVYSAAPTPFTPEGELDVPAFEKMLKRNIGHGVDGFFLAGGMGEWQQYGPDFKCRLTEHGLKAADGKAKILAGVTETGLFKTIATMKQVARLRPDACVVMLPPRSMTQYGAADYLTAVLDAAELPVFYYHCPQVNGMDITYGELEKIAHHPNFAGIKNSSANVEVRRELLMLRGKVKFTLFEGDEWSIDEAILLDCDGVLCGGGCLLGKLMRKIVDFAAAGDVRAAQQEQYKLIDIFHGIYKADGSSCRHGIKYAMMRIGIFHNYHCLIKDDASLTDEDKARIDRCLELYQDEL